MQIGSSDEVAGGVALVVAACVVIVAAAPLLRPSSRGWTAVAIVAATMALLAVAVCVLAKRRDGAPLSGRALMLFPTAVCASLFAIAVADPRTAAALSGLLTLCVAYVGLSQPPRTCLAALPPAAVTFVVANGGVSRPIVIRVTIALLIWTLLAEILARFSTQQAQLRRQLQLTAHTDAVTGIPNRRALELQLATTGPGDVLVLCDLDHFKTVNDTHGHARGDRVLADFGAMLRLSLREGDYCARYGGEEFAIVLSGATTADAASVLSRLRALWSTLEPGITFSAGIASCRADRAASDSLSAADDALYEAKRNGRNADVAERAVVG